MKRKRDRIAEHLLQKDNLESVLKSQAWVIVSAVVFGTSLESIKGGAVAFGLLCFLVFVVLSVLVLFYAAKYIVMPLEKAMRGPFPASEPHPPGLKEILTSPISSLFTIPGVLYMSITLGFFSSRMSSSMLKYCRSRVAANQAL
jgi:hypothetical protein